MHLLTTPTTVPPSALVSTTLHEIRQAVLHGVENFFASYPWQIAGLIIILIALIVLRVGRKVV